MAIKLEDYQELTAELPHGAQEVLRGAWNEAARAFSSRGLDNYLKGALALHSLGRGEELVVTYLQSMPEVARAIGEDVLPDLVNFLLTMASKTSGQVLTLIAATAPLAAERLGDPDLFRNYLNVLSIMLAQAPRGLRPMLENLDRLLTQLTLGGCAAGCSGERRPTRPTSRARCAISRCRARTPVGAAGRAQGHPLRRCAAPAQHLSARHVGTRLLYAPDRRRL